MVSVLSYHDVVFTDYLIDDITATVGRASDEAVLKYVRAHEDLAKGFQIKKSNCVAFRKKINRHIGIMHELDAETADFLYGSGIGLEFVTVFSYTALVCQLNEFAAIFGHAAFTLALLLDERSDIRELGTQLLECRGNHGLDKDAARMNVAENMRNFATHLSFLITSATISEPPSEEPDKDRIFELERQLKAEQKRNNEISILLKEEKSRSICLLSEKTERIDKLAAERNELRSSCFDLQDQIKHLRKELEQLGLTYDADVTVVVASRLEGLTNSWLKNRIQLEQKVLQKDAFTDLLAQAEEAIVSQTRVDKHTGNRRVLQLRLSAISAKLAEVRDIRANALHPIDELSNIETRLVAEEQRISRLLGADAESPKSPLVQALTARINTVTESETIYHIEQLIEELRQLGLSDTDFGFLQNMLGERYDRLVSEHGGSPLPQMPLNPALRFRLALGQGTPLTLVCDGHNILNSMEAFKDVRERSHTEARKSLSDMVTSLLQPYQDCTATIVYDGPFHNKEVCSDNVTVIYSGGGKNEKHRADRRIEEMLNWRVYAGRTAPVYVVTADYELGREARESGAEVISLERFEWMLAGM